MHGLGMERDVELDDARLGRIAPHDLGDGLTPGPGIDWVRASRTTPVGEVRVSWVTTAAEFTLDVEAPAGVPTEVVLPDGRSFRTQGGRATFTCPESWSGAGTP